MVALVIYDVNERLVMTVVGALPGRLDERKGIFCVPSLVVLTMTTKTNDKTKQ